jgi:hypothetical protein
VTQDAIAVAAEAANHVLAVDRGRALLDAVRHFRHVLSAMPDESLGPVSPAGVHRLEALCDDVVEHIEECLRGASMLEGRKLIDAVYQIRALLEETARNPLHYSTVRHA